MPHRRPPVSRPRPPARPGASGPCPCGTGRAYAACCAPFVEDGLPAATAEKTMRSRYVAYVLGREDHVLRAWHPRTRPVEVRLPTALEWLELCVLDVSGGQVDDDCGEVEFVARWRVRGEVGELRERSLFNRRGGRWLYVDEVTA